jgi:hypothetical protein
MQSALNLQMIQLKLNFRSVLRKVTPNIRGSNMKASQATTPALRFDDHLRLLFGSPLKPV